MDHAVVVSVVQGGKHLPQDCHRMFWLHRPALNQRPKAGARNKFHDEVRGISIRVKGNRLDDVGVRKAVDRMAFLLEVADVLCGSFGMLTATICSAHAWWWARQTSPNAP